MSEESDDILLAKHDENYLRVLHDPITIASKIQASSPVMLLSYESGLSSSGWVGELNSTLAESNVTELAQSKQALLELLATFLTMFDGDVDAITVPEVLNNDNNQTNLHILESSQAGVRICEHKEKTASNNAIIPVLRKRRAGVLRLIIDMSLGRIKPLFGILTTLVISTEALSEYEGYDTIVDYNWLTSDKIESLTRIPYRIMLTNASMGDYSIKLHDTEND